MSWPHQGCFGHDKALLSEESVNVCQIFTGTLKACLYHRNLLCNTVFCVKQEITYFAVRYLFFPGSTPQKVDIFLCIYSLLSTCMDHVQNVVLLGSRLHPVNVRNLTNCRHFTTSLIDPQLTTLWIVKIQTDMRPYFNLQQHI